MHEFGAASCMSPAERPVGIVLKTDLDHTGKSLHSSVLLDTLATIWQTADRLHGGRIGIRLPRKHSELMR